MSELIVTRESDTHVRIAFDDGTRNQWITMTAPQVDDLIRHLAAFRATMVPEVPRSLPSNFVISGAPVDPIYAGLSNEHAPERMLSIRHDGLGWLHFLFPQAEARKVAGYLAQGVPDKSPTPDHRRH